MIPQPAIFDMTLWKRRRTAAGQDHPVFRLACERLAERLDDMTHDFPSALSIGARHFRHAKIGVLEHADWLDDSLPDAAYDLIAVACQLHAVDDIPAALTHLACGLKPNGLLLANFPGGMSLHELRSSITEAESSLTGGVRPRISPFIEVRDAGMLLQRAGFALPVADSDTLTLTYDDAFALMRDVRGAGESNTLVARTKCFTPRVLFAKTAQIYTERYAQADGRIAATLELITLTGWKPHASQQKPLRRGSAEHRLDTALQAGSLSSAQQQ